MSDPQGDGEGSVPSVPQVSYRAERSVRQSRFPRISGAWWVVIVLLTIGAAIGGVIWGVDPYPGHFLAVSAQNYSTIALDRVNCVSTDSVMYDAKDFSDPKLADAIVDTLGIKTVLFNAEYAACPWGLSLTIVPGMEPAVRYNGHFARYLVSVAVCERTVEQRMNPSKCVNKNIYVFTPRVAPHDLFRVGLIGLKKQQTSEWEVFLVKRSQ